MAQKPLEQLLPDQGHPAGQQSTAIRRRILIVAPAGCMSSLAGAQIPTLAARLIREGHIVDILSSSPILRASIVGGRFTGYGRLLPNKLFLIRSLYHAISRHDVIHLMAVPPVAILESLLPALLLAKFLGKQTVVSFAGGSVEDITGKLSRFLLPALRMVDHVTVPTEWSARLLARHHLRVTVAPIAIESTEIAPRLVQDIQPRILSFIMAGPDSNITTILRAYLLAKQKYPRVELTLVGSADRLKIAAPLAQRASGIRLVDASQKETIRECWGSCDLVVNNSTDDDLPLSVLQALAYGIPAISCDAGGLTAVIQDSVNGLIFPSNDPSALAGRIIDLIEQPALVTRLSRSGPAEALRFTWPNVRCRWIALFNR
jgi:glycosyltransferase involved in cell wall biosynthesis